MRREAQSQPYETTSAFWQGRSTTTIRYRLTPSEVSIADETPLQITSQCGWETLKESKPHELSGCYFPPYVILFAQMGERDYGQGSQGAEKSQCRSGSGVRSAVNLLELARRTGGASISMC